MKPKVQNNPGMRNPLFQAHPWHGIPAHFDKDIYNSYIEIVPTDVVKYEIDKATGQLRLDRPHQYSSLCPTLYGFIPQTYCGEKVAERCAERVKSKSIEGDGDPMDVCVLTEKPIAHGAFIARMRPIGGLRMIDGNQADDKIVAVLESDLAYGHFEDISDCPVGIVERLRHYFLSYKQRPGEEGHRVQIAEVYDKFEALDVIERSMLDYQNHFGNPEAP